MSPGPLLIDPKTFLRDHCTLPSLPRVLDDLQEAVRSEDVDMETVADLIASEPALVAQVLKVVNSAYYGLPSEIVKVRMAIAFLGLNEIYRMVLSLSVINALDIGDREHLESFWFHAYYTTEASR